MNLPKRKKIWLVFVLLSNGKMFLRAVCTTQNSADHYQETALKERGVWRVAVEWNYTDHYFAGGFDLNEQRPAKSEFEAARRTP